MHSVTDIAITTANQFCTLRDLSSPAGNVICVGFDLCMISKASSDGQMVYILFKQNVAGLDPLAIITCGQDEDVISETYFEPSSDREPGQRDLEFEILVRTLDSRIQFQNVQGAGDCLSVYSALAEMDCSALKKVGFAAWTNQLEALHPLALCPPWYQPVAEGTFAIFVDPLGEMLVVKREQGVWIIRMSPENLALAFDMLRKGYPPLNSAV